MLLLLIYQLYLYQLYNMKQTNFTDTIFYSLEKAIKTYRQMVQKNIREITKEVTLDQLLMLITMRDNPEYNQKDVAKTIFKDVASVTRMIELLVRKGFITRKINNKDRRQYQLKISSSGNKLIDQLSPIILNNRQIALKGITANAKKDIKNNLNKITKNCTNEK